MSERVRLGDVIDIASGQVDPRVEPYCNWPHIGGDNIESGTGILFRIQKTTDLKLISGKYCFTATDVLYSKIRPALNKVALPNFAGICSADIYPLRPHADRVNRRYLAYLLRQDEFLAYAQQHSSRTNIPKINRDALLAYEFLLPSLPEQRRIADILDKADAIRRKRKEAIALTEELLRSAFLEMFGDGMADQRNWSTTEFGNLVRETQLGLVRSASEQGPDRAFAYMKMDSIRADGHLNLRRLTRVDASEEERDATRLRKGDFLFNTRNSRELVGKAAVFHHDGECLFNNNIMRVRFIDGIEPDFVSGYWQTARAQHELNKRKAGTTSVFAIYYKSLATLPIPVPPHKKQQQYAALCEATRTTLRTYKQSSEQGNLLFETLLHRAFSGQLTTTTAPENVS